MSWHVLYLRPRCEKKMAEYCGMLRLPHYLPLRRQTKIYQRRKVTVELPLFTGYLFASFDRDSRLELLKMNNIVRILEPPSQRLLLFQLAQVRRALKFDPALATCMALKKGQRVRILAGVFRGVEGLVSSVKESTKVMLNVDLIGQAVAVEVDRDFLEVID